MIQNKPLQGWEITTNKFFDERTKKIEARNLRDLEESKVVGTREAFDTIQCEVAKKPLKASPSFFPCAKDEKSQPQGFVEAKF